MRVVRYISSIFLITVILFGWGYSAGEFGIFPGKPIKQILSDINAFIQGGRHNKKSIAEKVANDLKLRPERMLSKFKKTSQRDYKKIIIEGLKSKRSNPLVYFDSSPDADKAFPKGYILIWGAFDFKNHLHGGILINDKGEVVHKWIPSEENIVSAINVYNEKHPTIKGKIEYKPPQGRFPHGLAVFSDGSIIFNDGDPGNGMQKIDFCSNTKWIKLGRFNHVVEKGTDQDTIWSIDKHNLLHKVDASNGQSIKIINVDDIMRDNPNIDILGIRRNYLDGKWLHDRWHLNDIDPMPERYKNSFPQFSPGDLLLSARSLNAIMVLDQKTKDIKWWRVGATSRQHDPDWQSDGSITVYDNQMRDKNNINFENNKYSRIVKINFDSYNSHVLYNGEKDNFYSNIRGKHQVLPNGNILITSSMQGRILIVNPQGETVFEFINEYDNKGNTLLISEAKWLPLEFFKFNVLKKHDKCSNKANSQWRADQDTGLHYSASRMEIKESISALKPIQFDNVLTHEENPYIAFEGWSSAEPTIRWTEGNTAYIHFRISKTKSKDIFVKLNIHSLGTQLVRFYLNDKMLKKIVINYPEKKELSLRIPISIVNKKDLNTLKLELPNARTPDSPDPRILAIALHSMKFTKAE